MMIKLPRKFAARWGAWLKAGRRGEEERSLLNELREHFRRDFLNASDFHRTRCADIISAEQYEMEKENFVREWVEHQLSNSPDREQARAIGAVEGHVQVVARAGSGKTSTLVNLALLLQQHCGLAPDEILLLAFNRKAAEEIRGRLASHLQGPIPHVMTFHALAYALTHPKAMFVDEPDSTQSQERALQDEIDRFLQFPENVDKVRLLMMAHFRFDWGRIVSGGYNRPPEEMVRYRRSLSHETLNGMYVKSTGEKVIANFLFEHDIKYHYGRNFWWNGAHHCPDFTIFTGNNHGIVIEYVEPQGDAHYDANSENQRHHWHEMPEWTLLEFFPHQIEIHGDEEFYALLKKELESCGMSCSRLGEEELWHRIKDRSIDRFTKAAKRFIQRARKLSMTPQTLSEMVNDHQCINEVERQFLDAVRKFYAAYHRHMNAAGKQDFDGLLQEAAKRVVNGETVFRRKTGAGDLRRIRHVLIDEYQDFSELFHQLMQAMRKQNPHACFFCVGDDWQAINGFAGSDLRFFRNFPLYFSDSRTLHVTTNYRSEKSIVKVGNALMKGLGKPARAHKNSNGQVMIADLATFIPTLREEREHPGDRFTPAVLRLVNSAFADDKSVVLLSRKNYLPWYVNYGAREESSSDSGLDSFLAVVRASLAEEYKERVTASTVHSYKGLEQDVVILLDAVQHCFPLVHSELIFTRIFGDDLERVTAEERRLFYVGLTRAVERLFILTESGKVSPFLEDMEKKVNLSNLNWSNYPPLVGEMKYFAVRVGNQFGRGFTPTTKIKDMLKSEGYRWDDESKTWYILRPAEEFSVQEFAIRTRWSDYAAGIEVRFCDDFDHELAVYNVDHGKWKHIRGDIQ
ncbi:MAG: UvrD-helicase domain-containing protein [Candidatus Poribacteria bacterium]|nr:UvrD-helicase domain-containing protein [Candidatus Poribacteria bacterium]